MREVHSPVVEDEIRRGEAERKKEREKEREKERVVLQLRDPSRAPPASLCVCACVGVIARAFPVLVRVCVTNTHIGQRCWLDIGVHEEQRVARPCRFVVGHIC